jgi:hypothetical protein
MTDQRRVRFSSAAGWLGAAGALEGRNIERVQVLVPEGFDDPGQPTDEHEEPPDDIQNREPHNDRQQRP